MCFYVQFISIESLRLWTLFTSRTSAKKGGLVCLLRWWFYRLPRAVVKSSRMARKPNTRNNTWQNAGYMHLRSYWFHTKHSMVGRDVAGHTNLFRHFAQERHIHIIMWYHSYKNQPDDPTSLPPKCVIVSVPWCRNYRLQPWDWNLYTSIVHQTL